MIALTDRENEILKAIIHSYILTAEAISSKLITENFGLNISAATVRIIMARLEKYGYIRQPHTSGGRVPTDEGYRYYIKRLMKLRDLSREEEARIDREYFHKKRELNFILHQSTKILSSLTQYTGLVSVPLLGPSQLKEIKLVRLASLRIIVIAVFDSGMLKDVVYTATQALTDTEINILSLVVNLYIKEPQLDKLRDIVEMHVVSEAAKYLYRIALDIIELDIFSFEPEPIYWEGRTNLSQHPEFQDYRRLSDFLRLLDKWDGLQDILKDTITQQGVKAYIGKEDWGVDACALIASPYRIGNEKVGVIGVVGPKRMAYRSVMSAVDYIANTMSRYVSKIFRNGYE